jgi:hypothetical protein
MCPPVWREFGACRSDISYRNVHWSKASDYLTACLPGPHPSGLLSSPHRSNRASSQSGLKLFISCLSGQAPREEIGKAVFPDHVRKMSALEKGFAQAQPLMIEAVVLEPEVVYSSRVPKLRRALLCPCTKRLPIPFW